MIQPARDGEGPCGEEAQCAGGDKRTPAKRALVVHDEAASLCQLRPVRHIHLALRHLHSALARIRSADGRVWWPWRWTGIGWEERAYGPGPRGPLQPKTGWGGEGVASRAPGAGARVQGGCGGAGEAEQAG